MNYSSFKHGEEDVLSGHAKAGCVLVEKVFGLKIACVEGMRLEDV